MSRIVSPIGYHIATPTVGAFAAAAGSTAGSMNNGWSHSYAVTYVTNYGETLPSSVVTATSTVGSINLTAIPSSTNANVESVRIYRTQSSGGTVYYLIATINNGVTTYTDLAVEQTATANPPVVSTADPVMLLSGSVLLNNALMESVASVVPAGTTAATVGFTLTAGVNYSPATGAGTGVLLPLITTSIIGTEMLVMNRDAANALLVYSTPSDLIGVGSAAGAASVSLAAGAKGRFVAVALALWLQVQ